MKYTHTVGEVQHLLKPIFDRYPMIRDATTATGITAEAYYRLLKADTRTRLNTPTYEKIMAAAAILAEPVEARVDDSWAAAAQYALTPEGRAYVAQCRAPKKPERVAA